MESVQIHLLSEEGTLPFMLQVRVLKNFKKGDLMLAPYSLDVYGAHSLQAVNTKSDPKVVHSVVAMDVYATCKGSQPTTNKSSFVIASPLLQGKKKDLRGGCLDNLAPFWGVCSAPAGCRDHNMECERTLFTDCGLQIVAGKYPKLPKGSEFGVDMLIMRNIVKLNCGDVLTLPAFVAPVKQ